MTDIDLPGLAACPFCGGPAAESAQYPHIIVCADVVGCGAIGPNHFFKRVTREAWNTRVSSAPDGVVAWQWKWRSSKEWTPCSRAFFDDLNETIAAEANLTASKDRVETRALYAAPQSFTSGHIAGQRGGIYIASKTKHADRWRFLRDKVGEPIISTWIDEAGEGETSDFNDLWHRCLTEATHCKVLIAYREPGEVLKGGWVEIGAALANNVPVFAVGLEEFTIAKYRGIRHFPSMKKAIAASRGLPVSAGEDCRHKPGYDCRTGDRPCKCIDYDSNDPMGVEKEIHESDGGAKAGSSPILASKEEMRAGAHGVMPVGTIADAAGCTDVGPSDPSPAPVGDVSACANGKCDWTGTVQATQPTTGNVEHYPMCRTCGNIIVGRRS